MKQNSAPQDAAWHSEWRRDLRVGFERVRHWARGRGDPLGDKKTDLHRVQPMEVNEKPLSIVAAGRTQAKSYTHELLHSTTLGSDNEDLWTRPHTEARGEAEFLAWLRRFGGDA